MQSFQDISYDLVILAKASPYFWLSHGFFLQVLKIICRRRAFSWKPSPLVHKGNFLTLKGG